MAGHHDPKLLYSIRGIRAYHIQDGHEDSLTPSGPQTLSLLMVPTSSPFADLSSTTPQNEVPDEDFYLHLHLPPDFDLPLPATTQIYHQPPTSYLIPRWDLGPESGAFTRIEFPRLGYGVTQDDVDTFETILAQCTAFLERARPPVPSRPGEAGLYKPSDYAPGGKYAKDGKTGRQHGEIVLVDEDDGSVVGELLEGGAEVIEDPSLRPGSKDPVEVQISADGRRIQVAPASEDYLRMARHPAYRDSSLVQNAAIASRLIVTGSSYVGNMLVSGAESFQQRTKPSQKPLEFSPATHDRVRKINTFTRGAADLSAKTVGSATTIVQNVAAAAAGHKKSRPHRGHDEKGNPLSSEEYRPGFLNKSMIAFSTVMDGIAASGRSLLTTSGAAASSMVGHRYGEEAGAIATELSGGVKNVGLVYIDVTGVSRRAIIKSVAKGMVIGHVRGGGSVLVGGGDGGVIPDEDVKRAYGVEGWRDENNPEGGFMPSKDPYQPVGFGNSAPARYQEFGQPKN